MKAGEYEEGLLRCRVYCSHGPIHHLFPFCGIPSVDQISVSAGNSTNPGRIGTGPNTSGHSSPGKPQGTGCEKGRGSCWANHDLQRTVLYFFHLQGIDELPAGQYQWAGGEDVRFPFMSEGGVDQSLLSQCSTRSSTLNTWAGRSSRLPSSKSGISLSNSGPECASVRMIRTGWKRSFPLTPVSSLTSFISSLKRSGVRAPASAR